MDAETLSIFFLGAASSLVWGLLVMGAIDSEGKHVQEAVGSSEDADAQGFRRYRLITYIIRTGSSKLEMRTKSCTEYQNQGCGIYTGEQKDCVR